MSKLFDFNPISIKRHNKIVRVLRQAGILPYQDGTYATVTLRKPRKPRTTKPVEKWKKTELSENGSVLNNKYACWNYPYTEKDF